MLSASKYMKEKLDAIKDLDDDDEESINSAMKMLLNLIATMDLFIAVLVFELVLSGNKHILETLKGKLGLVAADSGVRKAMEADLPDGIPAGLPKELTDGFIAFATEIAESAPSKLRKSAIDVANKHGHNTDFVHTACVTVRMEELMKIIVALVTALESADEIKKVTVENIPDSLLGPAMGYFVLVSRGYTTDEQSEKARTLARSAILGLAKSYKG